MLAVLAQSCAATAAEHGVLLLRRGQLEGMPAAVRARWAAVGCDELLEHLMAEPPPEGPPPRDAFHWGGADDLSKEQLQLDKAPPKPKPKPEPAQKRNKPRRSKDAK